MLSEAQFWWNWWVNFGVAAGTFLLATIAIFGGQIRALIYAPKLDIGLLNRTGEKTKVDLAWWDDGDHKTRKEDARYYHLTVLNKRRWPSVATQVQVYLLEVQEPGADEQFHSTWTGAVPFRWRHQEIQPTTRTIGHPADCDLCSVVKDNWLTLQLLTVPYNLEAKRQGPVRLRLRIRARAIEVDSPDCWVEISWNGEWVDGSDEMSKNFVAKELAL